MRSGEIMLEAWAMAVAVTSAVVEAVLAHARAAAPAECCGLLFAIGEVIGLHRPTANVHATPQTHFEIDPQALIDAHRAMRAGGPRLVGYYHSHPRGSPIPSATDGALATPDGMIWAIATPCELKLWRAGPDGFSALSYTAV
jgi:desampylase